MRYIEYVYLVAAIGIAGFIATNFKHMALHQVILTGLSAGIAAFMYSFRRTQRLLFEQKEREELEELKKQAGDDV